MPVGTAPAAVFGAHSAARAALRRPPPSAAAAVITTADVSRASQHSRRTARLRRLRDAVDERASHAAGLELQAAWDPAAVKAHSAHGGGAVGGRRIGGGGGDDVPLSALAARLLGVDAGTLPSVAAAALARQCNSMADGTTAGVVRGGASDEEAGAVQAEGQNEAALAAEVAAADKAWDDSHRGSAAAPLDLARANETVPPHVVAAVKGRAARWPRRVEMSLTGGCHCGGVRYTCHGPWLQSFECHCSMCRRTVGAASTSWLSTSKRHFEIMTEPPVWREGEHAGASSPSAYRTYRSSAHAARGFCARCGCTLTMDYLDDEPRTIWFTAATIDPRADDLGAVPAGAPAQLDFEIFASQRVPWVPVRDGVGQCPIGVDGGWVCDAGQYVPD
jgi:hypothetical protein